LDLSVVIVNWNTRDLLRACLHSLRAALVASPLSAEILVVDNASADGSAALVAAEFPEARLFANRENRNYAGGNNQGIAAATGDYLLLLNPDTEVPVGAPDALVALLRENPRVGAVSPALVYPDGRLQSSVRGFPTPHALLGEVTGLARLLPRTAWASYRPDDLPLDRPSSVDQPMASAFLVRKAALDPIGAFDEQFPLFFNDVDLCFRLKQAGWEIWYDPRVRVVHVGGASTRQVRPEAIRRSHEGLRRYYQKHYRGKLPAPVYAAIIALIGLGGSLRIALAQRRRSGAGK
jgi:GT2 family glycosyltransferase